MNGNWKMNGEQVDNLGKDICAVFGKAFENEDVDWWGDTNQLRACLDSKKQVYYLVEKEGDAWKLEFWIDSYAVDRMNLQAELEKVVAANARNFYFLRYYNARGCRGRLQARSADDLACDIASMQELLKDIVSKASVSKAVNEREGGAAVGLEILTIADALERNFEVPEYQRGYCWGEENVIGLLDDVKTWLLNHEKFEAQYRIGTVVLKRMKKGGKEVYEIIDGQQRLTTLFLYDALSRKGQENDGKTADRGDFILCKNNVRKSAVKRLSAAVECIRKWRSGNLVEGGKRDLIDFRRISIAAVIIPDDQDDLAFEFFNHLNSSGKPLNDYDLLKSHHLRYIEGDALSRRMADLWNGIDHCVTISDDGGQGQGAIVKKLVTKGNLLHESLYRIRMWLRGQDFKYYADEMPSHELFGEFTMDYEPLAGLFTARKGLDIDSLVPDGFEFFEYVEKYKKLYDLFVVQKSVVALEKCLSWHSYGTLFKSIHALSFFFFCKFGDVYLSEAIYAIAYRVSKMRNEAQIRRKRISDGMFGELANLIRMATHEGDLLGKLLDPKSVYRRIAQNGKTAEWYWNSLAQLGEKIKSEVLQGREYIAHLSDTAESH